MKNRNKKYNPQKLQAMRNQGKASRSVPLTALTPQQVALKIRAKQIIKRNSFPAIRDHREGCEFAGWMEISMASRPAEWRVNRMRFYGDWCGEKNLDKILPDIVKDTKERVYQIDLRLFGIQGEEYEVDTLILINPKNMDDLELKTKQYCASYAFDEDLLLNLDECYFEVRA
nr:hypothetical protein [Moraxella sp.]